LHNFLCAFAPYAPLREKINNMPPRIKICCISSIEEAKMAIQYGAAALGLVGNMPSGPGVISDELIHTIAKTVPPPIGTFLLTSETSADGIIAHYQKVFTNTIQIVDALEAGTYDQIKKALPGIKLVQVIHVLNERSIDEALAISEQADALLLDSGNPNLQVKVLGGTGRVHDWLLSRKIVAQSKVPVFLAGGLHAGNVKEALDKVQPFGLDLCSSVRTDKKLDPVKLEAF
jgi:phosphoribosylanthranilate isomerase